ncbi:MAG: DNA mismatch endonuclease Vsr [Planctomycetes bacterium]|nr:DNA mismatch endonuclease Vsr [Planctomycetota bacterium]
MDAQSLWSITKRPWLSSTISRRPGRLVCRVQSSNASARKADVPPLIVRRLIHAIGFRYRLHDAALPGCPDLVFRRLRKIIIVNGYFWHMHTCGRCRVPSSRRGYWLAKLKRNAARDRRVLRTLRRAGWQVLVIWECQTNSTRIGHLKTKILAFLSGN